MKKYLIVVLALVLVGCKAPAVMYNLPAVAATNAVKLQDNRPATEKVGELFSLSITNDAYGIYRMEENPNVLNMLAKKINDKLGKEGQQLEVKLNHFVIYKNLQSELKTGVFGATVGGAIGAIIAGSTVDNFAGTSSMVISEEIFKNYGEEYKRGLYLLEENPDKGSVFVYFLAMEIEGKTVFTRTLSPSDTGNTDALLLSGLNVAIDYHLEQF